MYSIDLRKLACHVYQIFSSLRKTAIILNVSHSSISRWLKNINKKQYRRESKLTSESVIATIKNSLLANPFLSIRQLVFKVKEVCNITVSRELIRIAISKIGLSKKKAKFFSSPKCLEEKTKIFKATRDLYIQQGRSFFSLDETSFGRNGKEIKGYSPKGQILAIQKSQPRMTTISSLVIISQQNIIKHQEITGSFNTSLFLKFLENLELPEKSVILLDNVRFHHSVVVKELANKRKWDLLFIPPYSPWYNPIEGVFSIIKRSFYTNYDIIKAFDTVKSSHCLSFFTKSIST